MSQEFVRYEKGWIYNKTSFWSLFINKLKRGSYDDPIDLIKKLESLTVPRDSYREMYKFALKLSLRYGNMRVAEFLEETGRLDLNNVSGSLKVRWEKMKEIQQEHKNDEPSDYVVTFYSFLVNARNMYLQGNSTDSTMYNNFDNNEEITEKLIVKITSLSEEIRDLNVDAGTSDVVMDNVLTYIQSKDKFFKEIVCYMIGLEGNDKLIDAALEVEQYATLLAMAEAGNTRLENDLKKIEKDQAAGPFDEDIFNRFQHMSSKIAIKLLVNSHNLLYSKIFNSGHHEVYFYGSPFLITSIINEDIKLNDNYVEAFAIYNEMYNLGNYERLDLEMGIFRQELPTPPDKLYDELGDITEENRYKVYDYSMDPRILSGKNTKEIEIVKLIKDYKEGDPDELTRRRDTLAISEDRIKDLLPSNILVFPDQVDIEQVNVATSPIEQKSIESSVEKKSVATETLQVEDRSSVEKVDVETSPIIQRLVESQNPINVREDHSSPLLEKKKGRWDPIFWLIIICALIALMVVMAIVYVNVYYSKGYTAKRRVANR